MRIVIRFFLLLGLLVLLSLGASALPMAPEPVTDASDWVAITFSVDCDGTATVCREYSNGSAEQTQTRTGRVETELRTIVVHLNGATHCDGQQYTVTQVVFVSPPEEPLPDEAPARFEKTASYYSEDDRPLWSVRVAGEFDGSQCRGADGDVTVFDPAWSYEGLSVDVPEAAQEAALHCVLTRRVLGVPVARLDVTLRLYPDDRCDLRVANLTSPP